MKALVKKNRQLGLWLEDVPKPQIKANEVLVKIKKTAICGTDIHIYEWDEWAQKTIPVPMHVGHEYVGEIVELGSESTNFNSSLKVGMRVSGEGHIVCGHCRNCRAGKRHLCINTKGIGVNLPGCFAEYLALPAVNVFPLPDDISDDEAAVLDPFGNAVHTALSYDLVGEDVLITGAGPIGIMAGAVAKHVGARKVVITDVNEYRLELARKMGIEYTINVKNRNLKDVVHEIGLKEGFDVGLEMSGNPVALNSMLEVTRMGGKIALLGIIPANAIISIQQIIWKGLFVKGIYGREMFETWYKMVSMLQSGLNIDPIFTHHFPVERFTEGFEIMRAGNSGKIILEW